MSISNYPQRIVIELTSECNLTCPMCPRNYARIKSANMTKELWYKLIDDISSNSPNTVIIPFWRGESLLHPDFTELMEYAFNRLFRIHISTNAVTLTNEYAKILMKCEFVTFSIHNGIGYKNAKDFLNLKRGKSPITQISFVRNEETMSSTCSHLLALNDLGGFDSVRIYEEHTKDGIFGKSANAVNTPRIFCPKLQDTLVIACDGSISRCNHIWITEDLLNANKSSIKEIWSSDYFNQIRTNYPDDRCLSCDQWLGHTRGESYHLINGKLEHSVFS